MHWQGYEQYVSGLVERHQVPGMAVAVARKGEVVYKNGFGFRDREARLPVTPATVFGVGSVTKSLTAMAIMQLEARGRLSTGDPVTRHLPEFRLGDNGETAGGMAIHHFLTHSSGLPPLPSLLYAMADSLKADPMTVILGEQVVKALDEHSPLRTHPELMAFIAGRDFELLGRPGRYFSYSNDAYGLLGAIIERVGGQSYQDYVLDNILQPAGMSSSVFDLATLPRGAELTSLYARDAGEAVVAAPGWWEGGPLQAAGFLRASVLDLIRYLEIYRTGGRSGGDTILPADAVRRMATPYCQVGGFHYGYGLGVTADYRGFSVIEHSGGIKGVSAHVAWIPEQDITAAVLSNLGGAPAGQAVTAAFQALLGLPLTGRRAPLRDYRYPPAHLEQLAGLYPSGEGLGPSLEVSAVGDRLEAQIGPKRYPVHLNGPYTGEIELWGPEDEGQFIRFLRDAEGEVFAVLAGGRMLLKRRQGTAG